MKIGKHRIARGIYLLQFETQYELTATFLRVQEHYESPRFHGRTFSLEQYMDWYAAEHGNFTYYQDWSGFNVPSTALRPFREGRFDPLSEKEQRLLRLFGAVREPFYVIGVFGREAQSLTHELAHALFFTDADYRHAVREAMGDYDTRALEQEIRDAGYADHVVPDETQAYLVAPSDELGAAPPALVPLRRKLRALFKRHAAALSIPEAMEASR